MHENFNTTREMHEDFNTTREMHKDFNTVRVARGFPREMHDDHGDQQFASHLLRDCVAGASLNHCVNKVVELVCTVIEQIIIGLTEFQGPVSRASLVLLIDDIISG